MGNVIEILTKMQDYENEIEERNFHASSLKRSLEPIFVKNGYRNFFSNDIPKILIIYDGGVGDFIMFTPVLRELKRLYGQGKITLLVPHFLENIAEVCPYIDDMIIDPYRHKHFHKKDSFKLYLHAGLAEKLLNYRFNIVFNFSISDNGAILGYLSGAQERILCLDHILGAAGDKEIPIVTAQELSTMTVSVKPKSRHAVDEYLRVLDEMMRVPIRNREMEVWFTPDDLQEVYKKAQLKDDAVYVIFGLGGMTRQKHWPVERYVKLAEKILRQEKDIKFVLVGGSKETGDAEVLSKALPKDKCYNLVNKLTYRQTAATMSYCHLYVGNDTGSMHIAAALKIPVLAVFACPETNDPAIFTIVERVFPYGVPAVVVRPDKRLPECIPQDGSFSINGCVQDTPHCITQVTVEDMWEGYCALLKMLS